MSFDSRISIVTIDDVRPMIVTVGEYAKITENLRCRELRVAGKCSEEIEVHLSVVVENFSAADPQPLYFALRNPAPRNGEKSSRGK